MSARVGATALMVCIGVSAWTAATSPAAGLTCATPPNGAELAIRSGWPEAAPYEYVVIATIRDVQPENGDSSTWGEVLAVDIDAVLRGDLPPSRLEIFNAPLGSSGWLGFRTGGQHLIAANPSADGTGGRPSTFPCAPNEEINSPDRFGQLVSFAAAPRLSNTAMPPTSSTTRLGIALVLFGITLGVVGRRRMRSDGWVH